MTRLNHLRLRPVALLTPCLTFGVTAAYPMLAIRWLTCLDGAGFSPAGIIDLARLHTPLILGKRVNIEQFFLDDSTPIYYCNISSFNLLGMEAYLPNLKYINSVDSFDGEKHNVFAPKTQTEQFTSDIVHNNQLLLQHPEIKDYIAGQATPGKLLFSSFDSHTEALANQLGLDICLPKASLREHLDSKITTTRLAEEAGIESVPYLLAHVSSYAELCQQGQGLGDQWVVQLAYGAAGKTTFFIASENEFLKHGNEISAAPEVKIMHRITCHQATIEASITRQGVLIGPLLSELIGFPELTPFAGGWCGNEWIPQRFSHHIHQQAQALTKAMGERLRSKGYRGCFGLDFLIEQGSNKLYLGELNPRITGATPLTTQAASDQQLSPLLLYHLAEWFELDYAVDVDTYNAHWLNFDNTLGWSQLIIDHRQDETVTIHQAPKSGLWRLNNDGQASFVSTEINTNNIKDEQDALFIRTVESGQQAKYGSCLGRLISRGEFMDDNFNLNTRAKKWVKVIRKEFK